MLRKGEFVAQHVEPIEEKQIQPHGVDLTVHSIYNLQGRGTIKKNGDYHAPNLIKMSEEDGSISILPGLAYLFDYKEKISIPEGHRGMIHPRSRLMRCGCNLVSAVWDSGYEGKGVGLIMVGHGTDIELGASVAQLELVKTEELESVYDGTHQGEGL